MVIKKLSLLSKCFLINEFTFFFVDVEVSRENNPAINKLSQNRSPVKVSQSNTVLQQNNNYFIGQHFNPGLFGTSSDLLIAAMNLQQQQQKLMNGLFQQTLNQNLSFSAQNFSNSCELNEQNPNKQLFQVQNRDAQPRFINYDEV